jgi:hypothetical protein
MTDIDNLVKAIDEAWSELKAKHLSQPGCTVRPWYTCMTCGYTGTNVVHACKPTHQRANCQPNATPAKLTDEPNPLATQAAKQAKANESESCSKPPPARARKPAKKGARRGK